jgi:hypothetical protein
VKCSAISKKEVKHPHSLNDESEYGVTANIIFNLAHLGISVEDSKYFDLETYLQLIHLEMQVIQGKDHARKATQSDIDAFFSGL